MKRLILSLLAVCIVSAVAWAGGPLLNFGIEPTAGATASFGFGWDFDSWAIIGAKDAFTWEGIWSVSALWTPSVGWADVRVGPKLELYLDEFGLQYRDMVLILGVEHFWGMVGVYGQLEIGATGTFAPAIGLELHFDLPVAAD
ncbi:MAG: hypothetical protein WC565_09215 [Parcubacteria group bacterium]|jgi:hypothetical protein|nr:hypothetical protein [Methanoregula sp.]